MEQDRFTPAEIKALIKSGELTLEDLPLLHPEDRRIAMQAKPDEWAGSKTGVVMPASLGLKGGSGGPPPKGPSNVEKVSREEFDSIGKPSQVDIRTPKTRESTKLESPEQAISSGDRITQILFGGLNAVGKKYPPAKKPPVGPQDLLQLIQNIKEVSKAGLSGVTRRSPK